MRFDDAGYKGGVWQCTLPACTDKKLAVAGDWAAFPTLHAGFLYFEEMDGTGTISRASTAGGPISVLTSVTQPFGLAVDDTHAYFTSQQNPALARVLVDGRGPAGGEGIGASNTSSGGFVALDDERVYWAYTEANGKGHVTSVAKASPAAGAIDYGTTTDNVVPVGLAVDADNGVAPTVLATGNMYSGPLALDDKAVYWIEFGTDSQTNGRLRKVAKP